MKTPQKLDIVVYGATGYTGRLVAEYLWQRHGNNGEIKLGIAGRSMERLVALKKELGATDALCLLQAEAEDVTALGTMVERTRTIISTAGPFQFHGTSLVGACAKAGTDYLDLCAEPHWIRRMIDRYEAHAKLSGARILFSCGFDSIPSELGVLFLQQKAMQRFGVFAPAVKCLVRNMVGGFSGGTAESLNANMKAAEQDPEIARLLSDPFALTPGFAGPPQLESGAVLLDSDLDSWTAPSMMAFINTRNVHRMNLLLGHVYGEGFLYDERVMIGPGIDGKRTAEAFANAPSPLHGENAPKPGQGPTREEREGGSFDLLFTGRVPDRGLIKVSVKGDNDPGYGATSKMISECAVTLLNGPHHPGGIWTPGALLQESLLVRLRANAGISFTDESDTNDA